MLPDARFAFLETAQQTTFRKHRTANQPTTTTEARAARTITAATQSVLAEDAYIAKPNNERTETAQAEAAHGLRTIRMHQKAMLKGSTRQMKLQNSMANVK